MRFLKEATSMIQLSKMMQIKSEMLEIQEFARSIHLESLEEARTYFRQQKSSLSISQKPDASFVSIADEQIEKSLRTKILKKFPHHSILGEEHGEVISKSPWKWILDPIDGTFSFVHGIPFYSSLLSVCYHNVPLVGFASLPELQITLEGAFGQGAYISEKDNRISVANYQLENCNSLPLFSCADFYRFYIEKYEDLIPFFCGGENKFRVYCDALGYYFLLTGSVQAFVDPKVEVWDVAPFYPILYESGLEISNWGKSVDKLIQTQNLQKPELSELYLSQSVGKSIQKGTSVAFNPAFTKKSPYLFELLEQLSRAEKNKHVTLAR
jgi:fructose-1,6-bisphosphatase/inositol monophosphatase family enzyme